MWGWWWGYLTVGLTTSGGVGKYPVSLSRESFCVLPAGSPQACQLQC